MGDLAKNLCSAINKKNLFLIDESLADEARSKTLKMLLSNFYTVKSIRIPLDFVITDFNNTPKFNESTIQAIYANFSIDHPPKEESYMIYGEVDYIASNFPATLGIRNFYPSTSLHINELERDNFLNLRIYINLTKDFKLNEANIVTPYTYTGYLSATMINGIKVFEEK